MGIAVDANPVKIILATVFLARSTADIREIAVLIEFSAKGDPCLPRRFAVNRFIKPSVFNARHKRISEHRRAGSLGPIAFCVRLCNQLAPHAVGTLIFEERIHHQLIAGHNSRAVLAVSGKAFEYERHSCRHPSVTAPPDERHIRRVIKKPLGLTFFKLNLIQIKAHLLGGSFNVLALTRGAIRLILKCRDHIHIIDPKARLRSIALAPIFFLNIFGRGVALLNRTFARRRPLNVGIAHPLPIMTLVARQQIHLKRHRTEYRIIHMVRARTDMMLRTTGEKVVETPDQLLFCIPIAEKPRKIHRISPNADNSIRHPFPAALALIAIPVAAVPWRNVIFRTRAQKLRDDIPSDDDGIAPLRKILKKRFVLRRARIRHGQGGKHGEEHRLEQFRHDHYLTISQKPPLETS